MAARRTIRRIFFVAVLAIATFIVVVVFFTWGVGAGGSGVG
jgi:hypothetical protein